ncbi:MAG TPA: sigma-70 family RNA polymerase sigma factor [Pyrinomonadaceae bacterium]|nr:sigma-70 family RNA polymerase sigma factor [Pyrinomonadaceae bacterium]
MPNKARMAENQLEQMHNGDAEKSTGAFAAPGLERSDARLVRECREGSQQAWDQLVARYQRLIFAIPRRAGLSEEQAADVFQEVFLTLFEKLDEIEQPDKIRSWIVTTAKFKTWATVRSSKGIYSPESEEEMELEMSKLVDETPLADDALIELEQQHLIRTALSRLEERCQKILSMLYLRTSTASYAEVASAVGVGETSISPLRSRCLKKLEKLLTG